MPVLEGLPSYFIDDRIGMFVSDVIHARAELIAMQDGVVWIGLNQVGTSVGTWGSRERHPRGWRGDVR